MTVIGEVRRRLDETVPHFWNDDELYEWLLEGATDIARRTETLQATAGARVSALTNQVTVPADLLRAHVVLWSEHPDIARQLEYHDGTFPPRTPSEPCWYTAWGVPPSLTLFPTPARTGTLYLLYYRTPGLAGDTPAGWQDLILDYAE